MLPSPTVKLPDADEVMGIAFHGTHLEVQYRSGSPGLLPKQEEIGPDTWYTLPLSIQSTLALHKLLTQAVDGLKQRGIVK